MKNRKGDWSQTYTGKIFWPLDPKADEVDIKDIAHALALSCRYNGHCKKFYSVAQHSVIVSKIVHPSQALAALLHDASEAYIGDMVRPLKKNLPIIREVEEKVDKVIFEHFGIDNYDKEKIKHADNIALFTERRDIMEKPPGKWEDFDKYKNLVLKEKIIPLTPEQSEKLFLNRFYELTK